MIVPVLALVALLTVPLTGGDLGRLRTLQLRHGLLGLAALALQLLAVYHLAHRHAVATAVMGVSYGLAIAVLWANRRVPGLALIGVGGAANVAAVATNGGVMPASASVVRVAGLAPQEGFTNSGVSPDAPLLLLGDVLAVPAGWPLATSSASATCYSSPASPCWSTGSAARRIWPGSRPWARHHSR